MNVKLLSAMVTGLCAMSAHAASYSIFTNQTDWQNSASDWGANPLTTIDLTPSLYQSAYFPQRTGGDAVTFALNAPFEITFDDRCGLCVGDPNPIVRDGSLTSPIERRNSLIITFGEPIYGFSGLYNAPYIYVASIPGSGFMVSGFNGFTSDTPFTQIQMFPNGSTLPFDQNDPNAGAEVSISDIQVETIPTPEPASAVLLGLTVPLAFLLLRRRLASR